MCDPRIQKKPELYLYIIESPNKDDLKSGRKEGGLLCQALKLIGLTAIYHEVHDANAFESTLSGLFGKSFDMRPRNPIVHISLHSDHNGIQFTSGESRTWSELRPTFVRLNDATNGLVLCMSSCEGFNAWQMALNTGGISPIESMESMKVPFFYMIGTTGKPTWDEAAVGYVVLYHQVARGTNVPEAVDIMKTASGHSEFQAMNMEQALSIYDGFPPDKILHLTE